VVCLVSRRPDPTRAYACVVRSHSVTYARQAALPDWLFTFQHELGSKVFDGRDDLLMLSAVLDELDTVVAGVQRGHGTLARPHWQSLLAEFDHTREAIGPGVAELVAVALATLNGAIDRDSPPTMSNASVLETAIRHMRVALCDPSVRCAAWDDALIGFRTDIDPELAAVRLRILRDLVELAQGDWAGISSTLAGALNNDTSALASMGYDLEVVAGTHQNAAGWSVEKRLDACREYVGRQPPKGHLIAWVAFDQASLPDFYQALGLAELWAAQVCPQWPREGRGRAKGPVTDFAGDEYETFLPSLEERGRVLMRLDLGEQSNAGAAEHARDLARTIVQMAATSSSWELLDGCAFVRAGHWWGSTIHPHTEILENPVYEPTGRFLADLDPDLVAGLVTRLPHVEELAADVKWAESVRRLPDSAQRAALSIRLLERRLPRASEAQPGWGTADGWLARARSWLREGYANGQLFGDLRDAAFEGVYGIPARHAANKELFLRYQALMLPSKGDLAFEYRPKEIMEGLTDLAGELPEGSMEARIVMSVAASFSHGRAAAKRLEEHGRRFDVLLRRAARVRNAVLHGNDTVPAVVESLQSVLEQLTAAVISAQFQAIEADHEIRDVLDHRRELRESELAALGNDASPKDVLFVRTGAD
jgi:hypothetical protein